MFDSGCGLVHTSNTSKESKQMETEETMTMWTEESFETLGVQIDQIYSAWERYAELKEIYRPWAWRLRSCSASYIELTDHDGDYELMPTAFLTDPNYRAQLGAEAARKRQEKLEREQAAAAARQAQQEAREREQLARLLVKYASTEKSKENN